MLAPLSWLNEFIKIDQKPEILGEKLTETGLGTEKISKLPDGDILFEFEITPNRPDLLSILGIAREIGAVENKKADYKVSEINAPKKEELSIKIVNDFSLCPRYTAIIIKNVTVKEAPKFIQERLKKMNLRPICNLVDITNYVMLELGNPLHVFDYDKIDGHYMKIEKEEKTGEEFTSLDEKKYYLPKDTIIIRDKKGTVIDLCGIKGGFNTAVDKNTKNIFIHVPIYPGFLIRKTSQSLSLSSDASKIYERGANTGGTVETLKRAVELVLEYAGGQVATPIIDLKKEDFNDRKITINVKRLASILGKEFSNKQITGILEKLNLAAKNKGKNEMEVVIPTYRGDLKIEEDIFEEVARIYNYNSFPKTIPAGTEFPANSIPYFKDYNLEEKIKNILSGCGFNEIYTYSLLSEEDLLKIGLREEDVLRIDNPVSKEFEYIRHNLFFGLINAISYNKTLDKDFRNNFFELGRVYQGKNIKEIQEKNHLGIISNKLNFSKLKGVLERIFSDLSIEEKVEFKKADKNDKILDTNKKAIIIYEGKAIGKIGVVSYDTLQKFGIGEDISYAQLNYTFIEDLPREQKLYKPVPKFPPVIEDINLVLDSRITYAQIASLIKKQGNLVREVSLIDAYKDKRTFRIIYQNPEGNLSTEEIAKIRDNIVSVLKKELNAKIT